MSPEWTVVQAAPVARLLCFNFRRGSLELLPGLLDSLWPGGEIDCLRMPQRSPLPRSHLTFLVKRPFGSIYGHEFVSS